MRHFMIDDFYIDFSHFSAPTEIEEGLFEHIKFDKTVTVYTNGQTVHRLDGPAIIVNDETGMVREYWVKEGKLHRHGGPALYKVYDNKRYVRVVYFTDGLPNNDDGPAITDTCNQYVSYMIRGKPHSINGEPSIQYVSGGKTIKCWHKEGNLHKSDGPAYVTEGSTYSSKWYLDGVCVDSQYTSFLKKEKKEVSTDTFKEFSAWYFFNKLLK